MASKRRIESLSAEVVMKPRAAVDAASITAANVNDYMPDKATLQQAAQWFRDRGFKVEAAGPLSFSITGPSSTFKSVFKMRGKSLKRPADMPDEVAEVTFPPPPDFGPTSY